MGLMSLFPAKIFSTLGVTYLPSYYTFPQLLSTSNWLNTEVINLCVLLYSFLVNGATPILVPSFSFSHKKTSNILPFCQVSLIYMSQVWPCHPSPWPVDSPSGYQTLLHGSSQLPLNGKPSFPFTLVKVNLNTSMITPLPSVRHFLIEVELIYNIILVSGVQHCDSIFLQIILHVQLL